MNLSTTFEKINISLAYLVKCRIVHLLEVTLFWPEKVDDLASYVVWQLDFQADSITRSGNSLTA